MSRAGGATLSFYIGLACLLLMVPILIVCVLAFSGEGYLRFPPNSFSLRWFAAFFGDTRWRQSLSSSLIIALIACVISTVLGFFAAYAFVRGDFRAKKIVLSVLLIREVAKSLGTTHGLAAEIVGPMEVNVQDEWYHADPELFHEIARELARVLGEMFDTVCTATGPEAGTSKAETTGATSTSWRRPMPYSRPARRT